MKKLFLCILIILMMAALGACSASGDVSDSAQIDSLNSENAVGGNTGAEMAWDELLREQTGSLKLDYAEQFEVAFYGDYSLITIHGTDRYLLVPENGALTGNGALPENGAFPENEALPEDGTLPEGIPEDVTVIRQTPERIYLVSTSAMDLIRAAGGLSNIRLTGTKESGWYIREAVQAMAAGDILYAGKYNAPDYELLLSEGCDLAIENTMIYHNPDVKEALERMGIPVLVEYSSYETSPLGRLEWIKLYGVLLGRAEEAAAVYDELIRDVTPILEQENTGRTVAFFYITANGAVNIHKPGDYIDKLIDMAGGRYVFQDLAEADDNALSTMNIQMEDFYAAARDADVIIYNSTIGEELTTLDQLLAKSSLLEDFKAVTDGQVYCTGKNFFQESTGMGELIVELHAILSGDNDTELNYLHSLK